MPCLGVISSQCRVCVIFNQWRVTALVLEQVWRSRTWSLVAFFNVNISLRALLYNGILKQYTTGLIKEFANWRNWVTSPTTGPIATFPFKVNCKLCTTVKGSQVIRDNNVTINRVFASSLFRLCLFGGNLGSSLLEKNQTAEYAQEMIIKQTNKYIVTNQMKISLVIKATAVPNSWATATVPDRSHTTPTLKTYFPVDVVLMRSGHTTA